MIKYLCDRCGVEVASSRRLSEILIRKESTSVDSDEQRYELCKKCADAITVVITRYEHSV